jgi:hypothetical protein
VINVYVFAAVSCHVMAVKSVREMMTTTHKRRTSTRATTTASKPLKVSEADIEKTCTQILEWDGWRSFKMEQNFSERKQKRTGEAGMPDRLYIRYWKNCPGPGGKGPAECADLMWIEWKALGGRVSQAQHDWQAAEVARGALVLCAGRTFPASIDGFKAWYAASGLQRRK